MTKTQGNFKLKVMEGEFTDSQIIVMLGENGTGKTTFIRMLVDISVCIVYMFYDTWSVIQYAKSSPF